MSTGSGGALMSSPEQLSRIMDALRGYRRLPFAAESIPGAYVEAVIARVRDGEVLRTYDFVDVINRDEKVGWQVKSTLAATPVTWKRAKIPNAPQLITSSQSGNAAALQALGDAIIGFCNDHARESMKLYGLEAIGYSRVCVTKSEIIYFERELVNASDDMVFDPAAFTWQWSLQKKSVKKEQLPALHGTNVETGRKWFAWHGLGENQLHFSGENAWWPEDGSQNRISEPLPESDVKISFEDFVEWVTEQEQTLAEVEAEHHRNG